MERCIFDYLNSNHSFLLLKEFIQRFCRLEVSLLHLDGKLASPTASDVESSQSAPVSLEEALDGLASQENKEESLVDEDYLQEVLESGEARTFELEPFGYRQMIVPLMVKNDVAGFLLLQEDEPIPRSNKDCETVISFVNDFMKRLIKAEVLILGLFRDKNLTHQQQHIRKVLEYVHEHYFVSGLSLKDLAAREGISYYYLSYLFKKELRINFVDYVKKYRISKALQLLKKKSLTVSQVAYSCGFDDPGYFSKAFKHHMGKPPAIYRSRCLSVEKKTGFQQKSLFA